MSWQSGVTPQRDPRRRLPRAAAAAMVLLLALVVTGLYGALAPATAAASSVSLAILDGHVTVTHAGGPVDAEDGQLVAAGDTLTTDADSHAVITFFDGSTVTLEPDTELTIGVLQVSSSGGIVAQMFQAAGRTWHVVNHALKAGERYELGTSVATATVRGTAFTVTSDPAGETSVDTTDGVVATAAAGVTVDVPPGFTTSVAPAAAPAPPVRAPEPAATVRVIVDATRNATVTDSAGRTAGVVDGLPVRYIPGSRIELVDGKLVITIPNADIGRLNTRVQPANADDRTVAINVYVVARGGSTIANVLTERPVESGSAKGGVVLTPTGVFVLPDAEARKAPAPKLGKTPPAPVRLTLPLSFGGARPAATPLVRSAPSLGLGRSGRTSGTTPASPPGGRPHDDFLGGFQPFTAASPPSAPAGSAGRPANDRMVWFERAPSPTLVEVLNQLGRPAAPSRGAGNASPRPRASATPPVIRTPAPTAARPRVLGPVFRTPSPGEVTFGVPGLSVTTAPLPLEPTTRPAPSVRQSEAPRPGETPRPPTRSLPSPDVRTSPGARPSAEPVPTRSPPTGSLAPSR